MDSIENHQLWSILEFVERSFLLWGKQGAKTKIIVMNSKSMQ